MAAARSVTAQELVEGLNEDLAHEYGAVILYNTYAAEVSGIHRRDLKAFFDEEVIDEIGHAQYLANKITALGGTPTTIPAEVPAAQGARNMLEQVMRAEDEAITRYVKRMQDAEAYGDFGLANDLHEMISDETQHKEEAKKLLEGHWEE